MTKNTIEQNTNAANELKDRSAEIWQERGRNAATRYLEERGYKILERDYVCDSGKCDIIAEIDDVVVFIDVQTRGSQVYGMSDTIPQPRRMPDEDTGKGTREYREAVMLAFTEYYYEVGMRIRFDNIGIVVVAPDRAIIRHHINALGAAN